MALVLEERFLQLTMAGSDWGNKIYSPVDGATHTLNVFTIQDRKEASVESYVGGPSSAPISLTHGRMLDTVTIEFPINNLSSYLASLASYRIVNTPKNIFLVGSILTAQYSGDFREIPTNSTWFVESFSIRRNVSRKLRIGNLVLKRWYGMLPS